MSVVVLGLSHKTAPVEVRERFALPGERVDTAAAELAGRPGIDEACVLSTCNRVEFLVRTKDDGDTMRTIFDYLGETHKEPVEEAFFYRYADREAIQHVFRVASSLDSMVIGEPQILGQVKHAYQAAKASGAIRGPLDHLMTAAFRVARRVRNETGIGQMAVSISYVAVELARKIFGELEGLTILVIGAGKMSEAAGRHLKTAGGGRLIVTNRTHERAVELAKELGGEAAPFDRLLELLTQADVVISSTGSPNFIITKQIAQTVIAARRNQPIFLVDIAVPRDIDPEANQIDGVFAYDIDDLQQVADANLRQRRKEAEAAERIVQEEVDKVMHRLRSLQVAPTIVSLHERLEAIRAGEVERFRSKLGDLTPQQEKAIEALTRGMMKKVAHAPVVQMKQLASDPEGLKFIDFVKRAFHLSRHS